MVPNVRTAGRGPDRRISARRCAGSSRGFRSGPAARPRPASGRSGRRSGGSARRPAWCVRSCAERATGVRQFRFADVTGDRATARNPQFRHGFAKQVTNIGVWRSDLRQLLRSPVPPGWSGTPRPESGDHDHGANRSKNRRAGRADRSGPLRSPRRRVRGPGPQLDRRQRHVGPRRRHVHRHRAPVQPDGLHRHRREGGGLHQGKADHRAGGPGLLRRHDRLRPVPQQLPRRRRRPRRRREPHRDLHLPREGRRRRRRVHAAAPVRRRQLRVQRRRRPGHHDHGGREGRRQGRADRHPAHRPGRPRRLRDHGVEQRPGHRDRRPRDGQRRLGPHGHVA